MKERKIAYITGTRADFGLMSPILRAIEASNKLQLSLYATGIHLMPQFGETVNLVAKEFPSVEKIPATFQTDDRMGMADFTADYISKLNKVLVNNSPDIILLLGDRVEMLATALACLYLGIPLAHVHGGEKTFTVDEIARHAITKMSHLHFPATEQSAERIKKMGEEEWRIHVVGAPALDVILNKKLPNRVELFQKLEIDPAEKVILVTQHPVTEEIEDAAKQMEETISAVKEFNKPVVVIYPHADPGGRKIISVIDREKDNPNFHIFPSLEYESFLALEREAVVWVGNSSAAMIESSSFQTPVINVGTRQLGRERGDNVIDVGYRKDEIVRAIRKSLTDQKYRARLKTIKNPWGDGKTGQRVTKILEEVEIGPKLLTKQITY